MKPLYHRIAAAEQTVADLCTAIEAETAKRPQSLGDLVRAVLRCHPVDPEHVVAAVWDLVEDARLNYDVSGVVSRTVTRPNNDTEENAA